MEFFKQVDLDWMGKAKYFFALSLALLLVGGLGSPQCVCAAIFLPFDLQLAGLQLAGLQLAQIIVQAIEVLLPD